jgi:hypothetical protein
MEKEINGQVTNEQISMWKNLHGEVFEARIEDSVGYLKKPDRATIKAMAACAQSDPIRSSEILLENCWLGGDERIKTDDSKFLAVVGQLSQLVEIKSAELKKL